MLQPELEALDREPLARLQLERMRATLARCRTSAAWRRRLGDVRPDDVKRPEDWARLPFLTKDELRDAYPYGLACGERYRRVHMSSGTTGNPILNPCTAADVAQWGEVMARCYVAAGAGPDDVIQITPSFGLFTGGFGFHYGAERLGAMVVPVGAGRTSLQLRLMRDLKTTVLTAIATYPLRLIEVAREERYVVEIVDPNSGAPRPDGDEGELVVSTLTREGLPLVRYRTHDLTRVLSRARCTCGRTSLRLDRLRGRTDDMVIYKGVNFYPRQVETLLLAHAGVSHEYQIVLEAESGGERMTVLVETEPGCDPGVAARIRRDLHDALALGPEIRLCPAGTLERPQGKAVRVMDRRNQ